MPRLRYRSYDLELRHTFRLARGDSDVRHNLMLELEHDGLVGLGEVAPLPRYDQTRETAAAALDRMAPRLPDPGVFAHAAESIAVPGQAAAEAAVDMAYYDLAGKRLGVPLYALLGLDPAIKPATSYTIGMDTPEVVRAKVREAEDFDLLKVKMGSDDDRRVVEAVREVSSQRMVVDANEGWTPEGAVERLGWLAGQGVEMVEQPLPAARLDAMPALREVSPIPLFADENVHRAADIPKLAAGFDGINIKLAKCGGIGGALRMIHVARAHGMKIMLGCMIETSLAITAAAHLASLVDYVDLDGHLLISNDPWIGAIVEGGRISLPDRPGLGVRPRPGTDLGEDFVTAASPAGG